MMAQHLHIPFLCGCWAGGGVAGAERTQLHRHMSLSDGVKSQGMLTEIRMDLDIGSELLKKNNG